MRNITVKRLNKLLLVCCSFASIAPAAELRPEALQAWDRYAREAEAHMQSRVRTGHFLWVDAQPSLKEAVRQGELKVAPILPRGSEPVAGGLIHDWVGAAFIPYATLDKVIRITRDYNHYKEYFNPEVTASRSLGQSGDDDRFSLRWATRVLFVSAGVDTDCLSKNIRVDEKKFYQTSSTTRVQEIQNFGKPDERQLAPDQGDGYVWRLCTITRYEATDGGVFLEIEALALTRDIPGSLRLLVAPIVRRVSANSLLLSLRQTREAVLSRNSALNLAHNSPQAKPIDSSHGN